MASPTILFKFANEENKNSLMMELERAGKLIGWTQSRPQPEPKLKPEQQSESAFTNLPTAPPGHVVPTAREPKDSIKGASADTLAYIGPLTATATFPEEVAFALQGTSRTSQEPKGSSEGASVYTMPYIGPLTVTATFPEEVASCIANNSTLPFASEWNNTEDVFLSAGSEFAVDPSPALSLLVESEETLSRALPLPIELKTTTTKALPFPEEPNTSAEPAFSLPVQSKTTVATALPLLADSETSVTPPPPPPVESKTTTTATRPLPIVSKTMAVPAASPTVKSKTTGPLKCPTTPPQSTKTDRKSPPSSFSFANITLSPIKLEIRTPRIQPQSKKCHYTTLEYSCTHKFTHPSYPRISHLSPCPYPRKKCNNMTATSLALTTTEKCPRCEKIMRDEDDATIEREFELGMQSLVQSVEDFKRKVELENGVSKVELVGLNVDGEEEDWEDESDEDEEYDGEKLISENVEDEVEDMKESEWVLV